MRGVSLSFMTTPTSGAAGAAPGTAGFTIADGHHSLTVNQVQVVLARIELNGGSGSQCPRSDGADERARDDRGGDCETLEVAPMLIDLPVDSAVVSELHVTVPAGTYSALEATLSVPRDRDGVSSDFLSANPDFRNVSVRVAGTFDGQSFVYAGAPQAHLEFGFHPPLAVGDAGANITIHADLAEWFRDGAGAILNPTTANAGGPNSALVADNIRRSFRAFRDDHRDGHDDDDGGDASHSLR